MFKGHKLTIEQRQKRSKSPLVLAHLKELSEKK